MCGLAAIHAYRTEALSVDEAALQRMRESQVKALQAGGILSGEADPAGLAGYYPFGTLPEPFTALKAVRALPAGSWLRVTGGRIEGPRPWFGLSAIWHGTAVSRRLANAFAHHSELWPG